MPRSIPEEQFRKIAVKKIHALKPRARMQFKASDYLHEASEDYLVDVFRLAQEICSSDEVGKKVLVKDMRRAVASLQPAPVLTIKFDPPDDDAAVSGVDDEGTEMSDTDPGSAQEV
jgi:histone H3/H4